MLCGKQTLIIAMEVNDYVGISLNVRWGNMETTSSCFIWFHYLDPYLLYKYLLIAYIISINELRKFYLACSENKYFKYVIDLNGCPSS